MKKIRLAILSLVLFSVNCFAGLEKEFLVRYEKSAQVHETNNIVWIYSPCQKRDRLKGSIFISPGRTESWVNWLEFAYRLNQEGFDLVLVEHRGQGRSFRDPSKKDMGDIDQFETYVNDFNLFVDSTQKLNLPKPFFALGNSMGAAILLLGKTEVFDKLLLYVPMFKIQTQPFPYSLAKKLVDWICNWGFGQTYVLGSGPFVAVPFEENKFGASPERYKRDLEIITDFKDRLVGGPSNSWVRESMRVPELISQAANNILKPVYILQAEHEFFVDNDYQFEICRKLKFCQIEKIKNSKHVLQMEPDENFEKILTQTLRFFAPHYETGPGTF